MRLCLRGLLAFAALLEGSLVEGQDRLYRRLDWRDGLPVSRLHSLAQGDEGFIWVATPAGMARYDGRVFHTVDREDAQLLRGSGAQGVFWRSVRTGAVWTAAGETPVAVLGPSGAPLGQVASGMVADDGALWIELPDGLWRRNVAADWRRVGLGEPPGTEQPRTLIGPGRGGAVFEARDDGLHRITPTGEAFRLAGSADCTVAAELDDGRIVAGTLGGAVLDLTAGNARPLLAGTSTVLDIVDRDGVLWIAYEDTLTALQPGFSPERVETREALREWRDLLVDREGGLWGATGDGLVHFPEPDTASWRLPGASSGRSIEVGPRGLIVTTSGSASPVVVSRGPERWELTTTALRSNEPVCVDGRGVAWAVVDEALIEWVPGRPFLRHPLAGLKNAARCAVAADGGRWLGTNLGLVRLPPLAGQAPAVAIRDDAWGDGAFPIAVYETRDRRLFVNRVGRDEICQATNDAGPRTWRCHTVAAHGAVAGFIESPSGDLWAATSERGVLSHRNGTWTRLGGNDDLPTRMIRALAPAAGGGIWIAGMGFAVRVLERVDTDKGWEIVESLGAWQALPSLEITDIRESKDRSLWLASATGVIHVPVSARRSTVTAPSVALVAITVDGESMPIARALELPLGWRRMSLRFAAASFRDPTRLRYRLRLHPKEPWQKPTREPLFRFSEMTPGVYDVEVEASLDGEHWSATPERFNFHVPRPWRQSPWLWAALTLLAFGAIIAAFRARLAVQARLADQRARIARDLHDHLGSGLGSIGLLSRVMRRPDLAASRREALAEQIRTVAGELATSLHDIVWSLKPGEANIASLAAHLVERGSALFPGDAPVLDVELPSALAREELSLAVRRNVLLIGLEALHNAARHSQARHVRLALRPHERRWVLTVTDDGRGFDPASHSVPESGGSGLGVSAMRARAAEIRAVLTWSTPVGGGTEVRLAFSPRSRGAPRTGRKVA